MAQPATQTTDVTGTEAVPAIDCRHLAHITFGDGKLRHEVLQLFDRQAELLLARMHEGDAATRATLAHTLSGSARGIGAWGVARAADASERAAAGSPVERDIAMEDLIAAVDEARAAIAELLKLPDSVSAPEG